MPTEVYIKRNGSWVLGEEVYIKRNGTWVLGEEIYIKENDIWRGGSVEPEPVVQNFQVYNARKAPSTFQSNANDLFIRGFVRGGNAPSGLPWAINFVGGNLGSVAQTGSDMPVTVIQLMFSDGTLSTGGPWDSSIIRLSGNTTNRNFRFRIDVLTSLTGAPVRTTIIQSSSFKNITYTDGRLNGVPTWEPTTYYSNFAGDASTSLEQSRILKNTVGYAGDNNYLIKFTVEEL